MKMWKAAIMMAATWAFPSVEAFVQLQHNTHTVPKRLSFFLHQTRQDDMTDQDTKPCFYKVPMTNQWQPRINIHSLHIGQALNGTVVEELLDGTTGPKLFLDCGVGRIDGRGEWHICNAMMRLSSSNNRRDGGKDSVTRKRATRLRRKRLVEVIVSRIYPESARLEVVTADSVIPQVQERIPASSLEPQQELVGTVTQVLPFGVFVDVGANRRGLLHIQKVADLYQRYIDKEKGLEEAGLERGARIRVQVLSNERKRLFLDFTNDVKQAAQEEAKQQAEATTAVIEKESVADESVESDSLYKDVSEEEAAAWAEFAALSDTSDDVEYAEEDDDYDEDRDIEDALGLGSY